MIFRLQQGRRYGKMQMMKWWVVLLLFYWHFTDFKGPMATVFPPPPLPPPAQNKNNSPAANLVIKKMLGHIHYHAYIAEKALAVAVHACWCIWPSRGGCQWWGVMRCLQFGLYSNFPFQVTATHIAYWEFFNCLIWTFKVPLYQKTIWKIGTVRELWRILFSPAQSQLHSNPSGMRDMNCECIMQWNEFLLFFVLKLLMSYTI